MLPTVPLKVQVIDSGPSAGGVCAVPDGRQSRKSKNLHKATVRGKIMGPRMCPDWRCELCVISEPRNLAWRVGELAIHPVNVAETIFALRGQKRSSPPDSWGRAGGQHNPQELSRAAAERLAAKQERTEPGSRPSPLQEHSGRGIKGKPQDSFLLQVDHASEEANAEKALSSGESS
jgi:hypothetical protein